MAVTHEAGERLPTGLLKRDGRYVSRRIIPKELKAAYGGRTALTKALGTSDLPEAKRRHHRQMVAWDDEFSAARAASRTFPPLAVMARTEPASESPTLMSLAEAGSLRERAEIAQKEGSYGEFVAQGLQALTDARAMIRNEIPPDRPIAAIQGARAALEFFFEGKPITSLTALRQSSSHSAHKKERDILLAELTKKWALEGKQEARTIRRTENIVARFSTATGKLRTSEIARPDVINFKDQLIAEGQSAANINVMIPMLGTIFRVGVANGFLDENPAAGVRVADNRRPREKRRAFVLAELNSIFSGPVYTDSFRPMAGGGEAAYWLPLLGLYTGARLTELGQLYVEDISTESFLDGNGEKQDASVMRIVADASRGQKVKNAGSERRIPLHQELINLGLLRYVEGLRARNVQRLFPEIMPNSVGELTGNWSKWFGRYRRSTLGIKGKDAPFHAFRHTFKDQARASEIATDVHNAITGHETGDVADSYGGLSYPLGPLVRAMERYRIPGLKLPEPWKPKD